MVSPFGFSFASLRWGAMVPSFSAFLNQYSAVSFLLSFGPQTPCTPDFSRRSITESWAAARVHRRLRRLGTGRRIADVLPPQLSKLRIIRNVVAGRGPLHARRRTVELDQPAELRRALGERLVP